MLAQSSSGSLIVTQDEALNHAPEHRIMSTDEDICSGEATSKLEEKKQDSEKKSDFEKKAGVKRKAAEAVNNGNEMDGESETPSNWGPGIRAPRPKVNLKEKIIGKKAGSYTMCEIHRILQHFNCLDRIPLRPTKDDLLQSLADLSKEKTITSRDRCWILRQPLGPGGLRYQTLNADGTPAPDSYPAGRAPRKKRATAISTASPRNIPNGPPRPTASKAMPPAPRFFTHTSMSRKESKKPITEAAPTSQQVPAEELLKMILPYLPSLIQSQIESRFVLDYDKIADLVSEKMHDSVGVRFSSPSKVEAIVDKLMKRVNLKSQSVESDIDSTTSQLSDSTKSPPVAPQMDTMPNLLEIIDDGEDEDEDSE
ncbi:hypothetical protein SLS56_004328 [Neofusicoccum ribis]|uniref:Uncharacterized protein n=1 Tax=Neofusicoccum ribis TaxID=45134 RepID=A0ABR3SXT9_9PEZI